MILYKFSKFCLIGFSGLIFDLVTTFLLKEKIKINRYAANAIGFFLAASSNYWLNRIWTFESKNTQFFFEYFSFFFITTIGLTINSLILWVLSNKIKCNFYFSKIAAIGAVTLWNFIMNLLFVFSH